MVKVKAKPFDFDFEPAKTALVCIDWQGDFVARGGFGEVQGGHVEDLSAVLPLATRLLAAARKAGLHVVHTREGHERDLSDCPTPKLERQSKAPGGPTAKIGDLGPAGQRMLVRGEKLHDIVEAVKPRPGEIVIDKPGKGAFYGTELHQLLANRQVSHLFICGVTTECCVSTTLREANDRGFEACLLSDAVAGYVPALAQASVEMACYANGLFGYLSSAEALIPILEAKAAEVQRPTAWNGNMDIATLSACYKAGVLEPSDVVEEVYRRIFLPGADPAVWLKLFDKNALLQQARELGERHPSAEDRPPLWGIPFSIKDSIDVQGQPTTGACPAFAYVAESDAPTVRILREAGALGIGKVNLDQLATGLVGMRSPYGQPASVFSKDHVSGGSSSGSCVSVASGQVSFSLATDTAGSGRVPAAFNGICGFKPTRGTIDAEGVIPCCLSLDCIAVEALSTSDIASVYNVLYGVNEELAFAKVARPPWATAPRAILQPREKFTFAIPERTSESRQLVCSEFNDLFDATVKQLEAIGGVRCPSIDYTVFEDAGRLLYEGSFVAERVSGVKAWYDAHPKPATAGEKDALLPEIREIYDKAAQGFKATDAWEDARKQMMCQRAMAKEFKKGFQVLVVPTVPLHPTKAEYLADPIALNHKLGKFTHYGNILDMCGISIPAGKTAAGMPFGVMILGQSFTDGLVLEIAGRLEERLADARRGAHAGLA